MADPLKPAFRASFGLDAAGEKVINVAKADKAIGSDGVNVDYFNEYNTLPHYKENRGYDKEHAVIFNNRAWYAKDAIASPAGPFKPALWQSLRVDPTWENPAAQNPIKLISGQYIEIQTGGSARELQLPAKPTDGDTITIKNTGNRAGHGGEHVITVVQDPNARIRVYDTSMQLSDLSRYVISRNMCTVTMIYAAGIWKLQCDQTDGSVIQLSEKSDNEVNIGDLCIAPTNKGAMTVILPKNVNDGEAITVYDGSGDIASKHITFKTLGATRFQGLNSSTLEARKTGVWMFVYQAATNTWSQHNTDKRQRPRPISATTTEARAFDYLFVQSTSTVLLNINLPIDVEPGDIITIDCKLMRLNQNISIKSPGSEILNAPDHFIGFPYRSQALKAGESLNSRTEIALSAASGYLPVLEFTYDEIGTNPIRKVWYCVNTQPRVERTDPTNRDRLGVAALASDAEVKKNIESNPNDETIVTPKTLANKIATEDMRGIAFVARTNESTQTAANSSLDNTRFMTVRRFDDRRATLTRAGVTELASQAEVNGSTEDTKIVTPKKLNDRKATPTQTGIAATVARGGVAGTARTVPGTLVYNYNDESNIVTPGALRDYKATETASGGIWLATEAEVLNGTDAGDNIPLAVTPKQLHKRIATEGRNGLISIASQTETNTGTNDTKAVTPKKLNDRQGTESQTGLSRFATEAEFAAGQKVSTSTAANAKGTLSVDPEKIKNYFSSAARWTQDTTSGSDVSGNIWDGMKFNILKSTTAQRGTLRLATPAEVKAGTVTDAIVNPKDLHDKHAEVGSNLWGLTRYATDAELGTVSATIDPQITSNLAGLRKAFKQGINDTTFGYFAARAGGDTQGQAGIVQLANEEYAGGAIDPVKGTTAINLNNAKHDGWAVTPRGLQKALQSFVPVQGVAYDSARLGGEVAANWVHKTRPNAISGINTFSANNIFTVNQTFRSDIGVEGFINLTRNHTSALKIGTLNAQGSVGLALYAKTTGATQSNNWNLWAGGGATAGLTGSELAFQPLGNAGEQTGSPVLKLSRTGDVSVNRVLTAGNDIVSGYRYLISDGATNRTAVGFTADAEARMRFGNGDQESDLYSKTINGARIVYAGQSGYIMHSNNIESRLNDVYLRQDGGTVSGQFIVKGTGVRSDVAAFNKVVSNSPVSAYPNGYFSVEITDVATANTYPRFTPYPGQPDTDTANTGTLTQTGQDTGRIQHWVRKGSIAIWVRTVAPNGTSWNEWGRMYTSALKPYPDEIGAWKPGETTNSITVTDFVKIKNLIIRPNPVTKTVDFEWTDN